MEQMSPLNSVKKPYRPLIFLATPCFGGLVSQHYMQSVLSLVQFGGQAGFDITLALLGHDSLITRSRNTLIAQFLQHTEATHLLFVDADIAFDPEQVFHMLAFDQDFVAGIYPLKVIDWTQPAIKRVAMREESFETAALHYVGSLETGQALERKGRFATGIYCGGGFMLLKRQVVTRLIEAYPQSRYKNVHAFSNAKAENNYALFECLIDKETEAYVSEDFGFCQKWRDIGGRIWLDTEGRLTHIGSYQFSGRPAHRYAGPPLNLALAQ
ncbi:hypothetical protein [Beijerinckia indica]|uniref:Uncharacterized protein n=1 Tax=Beijerinckia indica subsp. indica (strain ATCC 9039 / DSM 1715 / NCIMB 8712) TaxID=395963 RepID=B2ID08_BEII9|nr:hypothetical protein [Beijerinckia indica]ACB96773.1 conserved hypothetical protein [Beijerinckia indica subsp. indica ATCC 9039]